MEVESEMYTNCLLLGLDPSLIGVGADNRTPRVGQFLHSNPALGQELLYFILSTLRGPKEFEKVRIFDPANIKSREFQKVVQSIISELESQGVLPRSNSRVSSLATCCGPRFVELLWQLSLHALTEVQRRTYPADVALNPLPSSLIDVAFSHAAALLPVTKARIALERRKFLKNAEIAVQNQDMWSNLAHEITADYRGLCAEEASSQHELEKLHDMWNKVKMEGELWDELASSSSQNSDLDHLVQKATCLWDSLLSRKSQHEALASGPIEDMIAHREHRYRISGSSFLAAMDESNTQVSSDAVDKEQNERTQMKLNKENVNEVMNSSDEKPDRSGRGQPTVDIAEILRRWTHALQRLHKQSLHLANANDGEGPDLLRSAYDGGKSGHAEALAATLDEHQHHLASIQVLVNQLKGAAPVMQNSISELMEEVNSLSTNLPEVTNYHGRPSSPVQAQSTGRTMESSSVEVTDVTSRLSSVHIDKDSSTSAALKLPPLFGLTPNATQVHTNNLENVYEKLPCEQTVLSNQVNTPETDHEDNYIRNLKKSVREAARSTRASSTGQLRDNRSDDGSEHFFVPVEIMNKYDRVNGCLPAAASNYQVFSPPFLMDSSLSVESFEDLLAPLSETETALMEEHL